MIANSTFDQPNGRADLVATRVVTLASSDSKDRPVASVSLLLNALRRGWKLALPIGLGLSIIGALFTWKISEPQYSASAFLRIDADARPLVFKTADEPVRQGSDFRLYKNTQQQLLLTPFVLNTALRDSEVASLPDIRDQADPINWLQKNLKTAFPADGEIMQVSFETRSPTSCVKIVNGVVNAFMQEVVEDERNEKLSRFNNLERVYSEAEGKVRNKQSELKSLATALGTSDTDSLTVAQQSALQQFGNMQEKLGTIQFELMQAEGELKIAQQLDARQASAGNDREATTASEDDGLFESTPEIMRLEEEVATLAAQLGDLESTVGSHHPTVRRVELDLRVKRQLLEKRRSEGLRCAKLMSDQHHKTRFATHAMSASGGAIYDSFALTNRVEILKNQERIVKEKVDELAEETRQLGRSSIDVELMRSEIASLEDVLRRVGEEIERTAIELKTSSRIKLLSSATAASPPKATKRLARALAGAGLGFFFPLGLLVVWDLSRQRVDSVQSVTQSLALPTLGVLPLVAKNPLERISLEPRTSRARRRAELEEAVVSLTSMVLHCAQTDQRQAFMVSSAVQGEGKSTVACQLARCLASSGKRIALVDFDLRRPSIHQYMDLPLEPGLSETLGGQVPLSELLHSTELDNLAVLTAGNWPGNLHERYASGALDELFKELRDTYDIIIVDACPILPVHDARIVGKFADGVILTLVRDRTRIPLVSQACEILRSYGIPVLGTVMIGAAPTGYSHYYRSSGQQAEPRRLVNTIPETSS